MQPRNVFSEARLLYLDERRKNRLGNCNNANGENHEKKLFWNKEKHGWNQEVLHKAVTQMFEVIWFHYIGIINYDFIVQSFLARRRKICKFWNL